MRPSQGAAPSDRPFFTFRVFFPRRPPGDHLESSVPVRPKPSFTDRWHEAAPSWVNLQSNLALRASGADDGRLRAAELTSWW